MSKTEELKRLADRFAVSWCYDWAGGRHLLDGQADSIEETDSDLYEVKTSTWALNLKESDLELSKEVHQLTEQELRDDSEPMAIGDSAPGEFVDVEQWFYSLFSGNAALLNVVPESTLKQAVETYFDRKDCISDYFTEEDPFEFVLPDGLHPTVHTVLERLCREESIRLRDADAEYQRKIRLFDLIIETDPPMTVKLGLKVECCLELLGKGIALLNGTPRDGSAGAHGCASRFNRWIESTKSSGHLVAPVKGVFAGSEVDGLLAVAVFDVSLHETEIAVRSTSCGFGLFIGEDFIPQFIRN